MRPFNPCALGIGHLKFLGFLLFAPALELKKFFLRPKRQTSGFLLSTRTQRAAGALATRLLGKANIELRMSMLIMHLFPINTLVSLRARSLPCRKINVKSCQVIAFSRFCLPLVISAHRTH